MSFCTGTRAEKTRPHDTVLLRALSRPVGEKTFCGFVLPPGVLLCGRREHDAGWKNVL